MKKDPFRTLDDATGPAAVPAPMPRARLRIDRATLLYSLDPRPNIWYRFWTRVLLGWTWEEL